MRTLLFALVLSSTLDRLPSADGDLDHLAATRLTGSTTWTPAIAAVADAPISLVTTDSDNVPAVDGHALEGRASTDGRWIAFRSLDPNLDHLRPATAIGARFNSDYMGYLYVRDAVAGTTARVDNSPSSGLVFDGTENFRYDITADGRYIVFTEFVERSGVAGASQVLYSYDVANRDLTQLTSFTDASGQPRSDLAPLVAKNADEVAWTGWREASDGTWAWDVWLVDLATGSQRGLLSTTDGQPCSPSACDVLPQAISPNGFTIYMRVFGPTRVAYSGPPDAGGGVFLATANGVATALATPSGDSPFVGQVDNGFHTLTDRYFTFIGHPSDWNPSGGQADHTFRLDRSTGEVTELFDGRPTRVIGAVDQSIDGKRLATIWNDGTTMHLGVYDNDTNQFIPVGLLPTGDEPSGLLDLSIAPSGTLAVFSANGNYGWGLGRATYEQTLPGASPLTLTATGGDEQVGLAWHSSAATALVVVRQSETGPAPACSTCGELVYRGTARHATARGLTNGRHYNFAVFSKTTTGRVISRKVVAAKAHQPRETNLSASPGGIRRRGNAFLFTGVLRWTTPGLAVPHRHIRVYSRPHGTGEWRFVTDLTSDGLGYYQFRTHASTSRDYQFRYPGNKSYAPARSQTRTVRSSG